MQQQTKKSISNKLHHNNNSIIINVWCNKADDHQDWEKDKKATIQAGIVVVLSSLAAGVGALQMGMSNFLLAPVMSLLTQQQSLMDEIRRDVKSIKEKALGETQEIRPPSNQTITEKANSMGFNLKPITELGPEDTIFPMD